MSNDVAVVEHQQYGVVNFEEYAMNVDAVIRQVNVIQDVMRGVMKVDEHYGTIPGTKKPSLYKPGAEKLSLVFRLRPEYEVRRSDLPGAHREYEVVCTLFHIPTGQSVGQGVGSATTMEGKYRYRKGELICPDCEQATIIKGKTEFGGGWICYQKKGGCGKKWTDADNPFEGISVDKIEHDNPADYYNTILKMAKKRAHVDAILTATAASDIFTQDVEDMPEVIPGAKGAAKKEKKEPLKEPQKKGSKPPETGKADPAPENKIGLATVSVTSIELREGVTDGKPWKMYGITGDDGNAYKTFSETLADIANTAKQAGQKIQIDYKENKNGRTIRNMQPVEVEGA